MFGSGMPVNAYYAPEIDNEGRGVELGAVSLGELESTKPLRNSRTPVHELESHVANQHS
jgi:hypothetical protein